MLTQMTLIGFCTLQLPSPSLFIHLHFYAFLETCMTCKCWVNRRYFVEHSSKTTFLSPRISQYKKVIKGHTSPPQCQYITTRSSIERNLLCCFPFYRIIWRNLHSLIISSLHVMCAVSIPPALPTLLVVKYLLPASQTPLASGHCQLPSSLGQTN